MKSIYFEKNIPKILATKAAAKLCKPLLFSGLNAVKYDRNLKDCPLPEDDWVAVSNTQTGICGTDLSFFLSTTGTSIALEPMPTSKRTYLGHETVGTVSEAGARSGYSVGQRVTLVRYMASCSDKCIKPPCPACAKGEYCLCENYGKPGKYDHLDIGAGFGDRYIAPASRIMAVDDRLSDDDAVMLEPAAVALHSIMRRIPQSGERVLVLGAGVIGLAIIGLLKILAPDCEVHAMVRSEYKRALAKKLGVQGIISGEPYSAIADLTGAQLFSGMMGNKMMIGGFDCIYDCVGTPSSMHDSLRWLKARGVLVKVGHHMSPTKFDETPLWWQELTVIGVDSHGMEQYEGQNISSFELAQRFIAEGKFKTEGFITHRFALDDYKSAFKLMVNHPPDLIKAVLTCK